MSYTGRATHLYIRYYCGLVNSTQVQWNSKADFDIIDMEDGLNEARAARPWQMRGVLVSG